MYVCDRCGELCSEDDLPTYEEDFGIDTGVGWKSMTQTFTDNCSCGGQFIEADKCEICDGYFDGSNGNVCEECKENYVSVDTAIEVGDEEKESCELNSFLLRAFSPSEIETILKREIKQSEDIYKGCARKYLLDNDYYEDWLIENKNDL